MRFRHGLFPLAGYTDFGPDMAGAGTAGAGTTAIMGAVVWPPDPDDEFARLVEHGSTSELVPATCELREPSMGDDLGRLDRGEPDSGSGGSAPSLRFNPEKPAGDSEPGLIVAGGADSFPPPPSLDSVTWPFSNLGSGAAEDDLYDAGSDTPIADVLQAKEISPGSLLCGCPDCVAARAAADDGTAFNAQDVTPAAAPIDVAAPAAAPSPPSYVDALINEYDYQWGSVGAPGTSATVTYSFLSSVPGYYDPGADERIAFAPMNATQQAVVRGILQDYAAVANVTFVEVSGAGSITFGTADLGPGIAGWAYYPYPGYSGPSDNDVFGDVWITNRYTSYANPIPGTWEYNAFIHEIGHALGLKHPGNYNAGGGGTGGPYLPSAEDSHQYTVMSYYTGPSYGGKEPLTPQLYDVAAMQYLYGANTSYHAGADTYAFATSTQVKTIWDGGGVDTFDASNQIQAVSIDLHPGSFSSIAGTNNIAIAFGCSIESAIGSNYNDALRERLHPQWRRG